MQQQSFFQGDPEKQGLLEALLFVSGEPLPVDELAKAVELGLEETHSLLDEMARCYQDQGRGIRLQVIGGQAQLCSASEYAPMVERLLLPAKKQTLSQAALETLSIVAYRQPVTRADVDRLRGVKSDYTMSVLVERGLIAEKGRKDTLGRPILYGTTVEFLKRFGLSSLETLPPLPPPEDPATPDEQPLWPDMTA